MRLVARLGIKLVRVKKRVLKPIFRRNKAGVFVPMAFSENLFLFTKSVGNTAGISKNHTILHPFVNF